MSSPRLRFDRGTLLVEGVPLEQLPPGFRADDRLGGTPRGDAMLYREVVADLHRSGASWTDDARNYDTLHTLEHVTQRTPRDYQAEAVTAWRAAGRRGVVVLPTGAGKTFVAELAVAQARRSTLVLAPTIDLVNQWHHLLTEAFGASVGPVGVLGGGQHTLGAVTVSTYDSAWLHMDRYGARFGLLICDEVHHLPSEAYAQAACMCLAPLRLGLTATLERSDDRHLLLDELVGPLVYHKGIRELAGAVLAEYRVVTLEVELSPDEADRYIQARATYRDFLSQRRISMRGPDGWGRFLQEAARSKAGRAALRAHREARAVVHGAAGKLDALEQVLQRHPDGRVLVFTNDNATAYAISRAFGVPCITHQTDGKERRMWLDGFRQGRWRVLATSRVLNEGVDLPAADVGVVVSGTSTVREHVQRLGRILRPAEGKQAVLYELVTVDTVEELSSARRREHDAYREA